MPEKSSRILLHRTKKTRNYLRRPSYLHRIKEHTTKTTEQSTASSSSDSQKGTCVSWNRKVLNSLVTNTRHCPYPCPLTQSHVRSTLILLSHLHLLGFPSGMFCSLLYAKSWLPMLHEVAFKTLPPLTKSISGRRRVWRGGQTVDTRTPNLKVSEKLSPQFRPLPGRNTQTLKFTGTEEIVTRSTRVQNQSVNEWQIIQTVSCSKRWSSFRFLKRLVIKCSDTSKGKKLPSLSITLKTKYRAISQLDGANP